MIDRKLLAALRAKEDARFLEQHPVSGKMFAEAKGRNAWRRSDVMDG